MHVIHIVNNCNRGGAGHVILSIIKELSKKNITFTVAYLTGPELLKKEFESIGANTMLLGKNPIKILVNLLRIIKRKEKSKLIFHTHLVHASLIGRFMGIICNIPVITTRHYRERRRNNVFYILEDLTLKWSSYVIAISKSVKNYLINFKYIKEYKCIKIYNPLDSRFEEDNRRIKTEEFRIIFIGRLNIVKGVNYLIEAFEQICFKIPNSKLIIIGQDDKLKKNIRKQVNTHPYKDRISFLGFLNTEEIKEELSKADVYVQPSLSEGLGIASIEAMAMECPSILSKVGGLVELSDNNKNAILVPPKNSKNIFDAVLWCYRNSEEANNIAKNGKKYIFKNFNSKLICNEYYNVYKQIIREK